MDEANGYKEEAINRNERKWIENDVVKRKSEGV